MVRKSILFDIVCSIVSQGDVVYLEVLGQPMLLLGSHTVARELLDKRSAVYSDRLPSVMVQLYVRTGGERHLPTLTLSNRTGLDHMFVLQNYSSRWRLHRRFTHQSFNPDFTRNYQNIQLASARWLLCAILRNRRNVVAHLRLSVAVPSCPPFSSRDISFS